jgi:hypothetical protein
MTYGEINVTPEMMNEASEQFDVKIEEIKRTPSEVRMAFVDVQANGQTPQQGDVYAVDLLVDGELYQFRTQVRRDNDAWHYDDEEVVTRHKNSRVVHKYANIERADMWRKIQQLWSGRVFVTDSVGYATPFIVNELWETLREAPSCCLSGINTCYGLSKNGLEYRTINDIRKQLDLQSISTVEVLEAAFKTMTEKTTVTFN